MTVNVGGDCCLQNSNLITITRSIIGYGTGDAFLIYQGGFKPIQEVTNIKRKNRKKFSASPINITNINDDLITYRESGNQTHSNPIHFQFGKLRISGELKLKTNNEEYIEFSLNYVTIKNGSIIGIDIIDKANIWHQTI